MTIKNINIPIVLLALFSACFSFAQQDSQYTQYMYNTSIINPAYAGSRGVTSINTLYRTQWVGLNGAPKTIQGSINAPIGNNIGLGFSVVNDEIGPSKESNINADFSYTLNLNKYKLSFGLKAGINILDVNFNELVYDNQDPNATNIDNRLSPNLGVGLYLHDSERWYIGLSSPNLLKTDHYSETVSSSKINEEIHAYFIGGYVFTLSDNTKFKPAFLLKTVTGSPLAIDLSANFLFVDKFTLGAAYRLDAAVSALAGFQISEQLMVGYAYDYETTEFSKYNSGSHELFLRFELFSAKNNLVNPRFF